MKVEDIVDKAKHTVSTTLSEGRTTAMSERIKAIAEFCFVHDIGLKGFAEEYDLNTREDLNWSVARALAEPPYNAGKNQNDDHSNYGVFESNNIENVLSFFRVIVKPGAYAHLFIPTLQLSLFYKPLASEKCDG